MNTHVFEHIVSGKTKEVIRSVELFLTIAVIAIVVSFVCLSVA